MRLGEHKITHYKKWDDGSAKYNEHWSLWEVRKTLFGKLKWKPVWCYPWGEKDQVRYYRIEDAKRAAKHHGIEMPA